MLNFYAVTVVFSWPAMAYLLYRYARILSPLHWREDLGMSILFATPFAAAWPVGWIFVACMTGGFMHEGRR